MDSNIYYGKCQIIIDDKIINLENASININHILRDESNTFDSKPKNRYMGFELEVKDKDTLIHKFRIEYIIKEVRDDGGMLVLCDVTGNPPIKDSNCNCHGCNVYKVLSKKYLNKK